MSDVPPGLGRDWGRDWGAAVRQSRAWRRAVAALGWVDDPGRHQVPGPVSVQGPIEVLTAKILFSHARNRQQLLGPPPTALGHLDDSRTELLIQAAILAARASGPFDEDAERRMRGVLSSVGLQSTDPGFLARALAEPIGLDDILHQVRDAHVLSLVYAASLLGADGHDEAGQAWLRYLALRMKIPAETLVRLHSQFGVAA